MGKSAHHSELALGVEELKIAIGLGVNRDDRVWLLDLVNIILNGYSLLHR